MAFKDLPDTLTEKPFTLARQIEYNVTNGLGYNTQTNFDSYNSEEIKNSKKGLQAHLAHLEMNSKMPKIRGLYWMLENEPENFEFPVRSYSFFGLVKGELVYKKLNPKKREIMKDKLENVAQGYKKLFELTLEEALCCSLIEKIIKKISNNFKSELLTVYFILKN